jgi:hypothetical protein
MPAAKKHLIFLFALLLLVGTCFSRTRAVPGGIFTELRERSTENSHN